METRGEWREKIDYMAKQNKSLKNWVWPGGGGTSL